MEYRCMQVGDGQSIDAQLRDLTNAGCTKVSLEVASNAKTAHVYLPHALMVLDGDGVLMVIRPNRLARSTRDLRNTPATDKQAHFHSLGDTWSEFERELIGTHTGEGHARTGARGVKSARNSTLTVHRVNEALRRRDSLREIAPSYSISPARFHG